MIETDALTREVVDERMPLLIALNQEIEERKPDLKTELQKESEVLQSELARFMEMIAGGHARPQSVLAEVEKRESQIEANNQQIESLENEVVVDIDTARDDAEQERVRIREILRGGDVIEARKLLDTLLEGPCVVLRTRIRASLSSSKCPSVL